jgi:ABC-2 type transport system permease protein
MYPAMQLFSRIFPFTYYTDLFINQALRGAPAVDSIVDLGALAVYLVLPLAVLGRLRTICTNENYWGRQ